MLADRGYDADWIRRFVGERGAWANIPPKRNRTIRKDKAATQRFWRGSGPPEKVFNEFWKPSRGRLGARRGRKVLDDRQVVDFSLQVGV